MKLKSIAAITLAASIGAGSAVAEPAGPPKTDPQVIISSSGPSGRNIALGLAGLVILLLLLNGGSGGSAAPI